MRRVLLERIHSSRAQDFLFKSFISYTLKQPEYSTGYLFYFLILLIPEGFEHDYQECNGIQIKMAGGLHSYNLGHRRSGVKG